MNHLSTPAPESGTVAVILAGGIGARVGLATPKQLIPVAGQTSLEHTLAVFDSTPASTP